VRNVRVLAVLACIGITAHAVPAFASERRGLALNWIRLEGAERCLTAAELASRIEASVGRVLFVRAAEAELSIDGYVRAEDEPRGFRMTFQFSLPSREIVGRREVFLKGSDCSVIDSSVGFLTKVMLDPHGIFDTGDPLDPRVQRVLDGLFAGEPMDPIRELTTPAAAVAVADSDLERVPSKNAPPAAPRPRPTEPAAKRDVAAFDAVGIADLGQMPGVGLGIGLHAGVGTSGGWLIELGFASYPQRTAEAASGQVAVELELGSLAICPLQLLRVLALCGGGEYGRMGVSPKNFQFNAAPASRAVVDVFATGVLRLRLVGLLFLRAATSFVVPLLGNEFFYEARTGEKQVFRTSPVAGRAELGFGVHL
jgi:hypothetical protein